MDRMLLNRGERIWKFFEDIMPIVPKLEKRVKLKLALAGSLYGLANAQTDG
jgi:hypothetical protein